MKKLVFSLFAAVAISAFAEDVPDYQAIYWQVGGMGSQYYDASYANLFAAVDGARVGQRAQVLSEGKGSWETDVSGWNNGILGNASFFVELYNDAGELLITSYGIDYATLLKSCMDVYYNDSTHAPVTATSSWTSGYCIPEPTSALLLLIGVAGLALRRKRA